MISGRSHGEKHTRNGVGGDGCILSYDAGNVVVIDVHGFDGGQVDQRVSPLPDFVGGGEE